MRRTLILAAFGAALWLLLAGPAWLALGDAVLIQSGVALALCLVPALATMFWVERSKKVSPDLQMMAVLGGSGIRMGIALGVGALLFFQYRETFTAGFLIWILVFYLAILACEVTLILKTDSAAQPR